MKKTVLSIVLAVSIFLGFNNTIEENRPVEEHISSMVFHLPNSNDPGSMH